jgi:hypothetical protein
MTIEPMTPNSRENSAEVGIDVQRLVMPRRPVCGWRWVKCDDCGTTWKETSRDILSPSGVDCPNRCDHGGDTHVWKTERADLPRDQSGNLLEYRREILTKGLGHNSQDIAPEGS